MDRTEAIEHLKVVLKTCDVQDEEAVEMAIAALEGKDIDVSTNSALDHIHNVVAENERKSGYEQAKAEYDHKLMAIKNTIKDYYYIYGYEKGRKDAAPKWIPFTAETAPKEDGHYLIKMKTATGNESVKTDSYSTAYGEWFIYSNDIVIQWMPIP